MPSLDDTLQALEWITGGYAPVDAILVTSSRCTAIRGRTGSCGMCQEVCPTQAVSIRFPQVQVDASLCTGCGACATVCPTTALSLGQPSQQQLVQALVQVTLASGGEPVIACSKILEEKGEGLDRNRVLPVACLDMVDEMLLLSGILQGARETHLCKSDCLACGKGSSGAVCSLIAEGTQQLLQDWGAETQVHLVQGLPESAFLPPESLPDQAQDRRGFLRDLKDRGKQAAVQAAGGFLEERYGQILKETVDIDLHLKPLDRQAYLEDLSRLSSYRSLVVLAQLAAFGSPKAQQVDSRLWAEPVVEVYRCTDCGSCYGKCPTGALSRVTEGEDTWIQVRRGQCVACGLCASLCRHDALELCSLLSPDQLLEGSHVRYPLPPSPAKAYFLQRKKSQDQV